MTAEEGRFPEIACCMQQLLPNAALQACVQNPLKIPTSPETRTVPLWLMVALRPPHTVQNSQTALAEGKTHLTAHQAKRGEMLIIWMNLAAVCLSQDTLGGWSGDHVHLRNRAGAMPAPCGLPSSRCLSITSKSPSSLLEDTRAQPSAPQQQIAAQASLDSRTTCTISASNPLRQACITAFPLVHGQMWRCSHVKMFRVAVCPSTCNKYLS